MHPIERLRYVARSSGGDQRTLVRETAGAICGLKVDPAGLIVACRRIVERHPSSAALWWLCAHLVTSPEPFRAAWALADHLEADPTPAQLVELLPEGGTVCVVGWPDLAGEALIQRGDVTALVVETGGEGGSLVRRLRRCDADAEEVPAAGTAAAVQASDLVIVEAVAAGPDGALCALGSHSAAAVAYCAEIPVWLVVGRGRRLPEPMWATMLQRLVQRDDGWHVDVEGVPLAMVTSIVGPDGLADPAAPLSLAAECPVAPEMLRPSVM